MRRFRLALIAAVFLASIPVGVRVAGYTLVDWQIVPVWRYGCAAGFGGSGGYPCAVATSYTMTGPSSGTVGTAYTFTYQANGTTTATATPSDNGHTGTFSPTSTALSIAPKTFTYTPATAGTYNISSTNSGTLTNPSAISFTAISSGGALTIDSQETSNLGHHSTATPYSWAFTNAAGNLLVLAEDCTASGTAAPTINTPTYNGVSMTAVTGGSLTFTSSNATTIKLFYLKTPATGTNTLSASFSSSAGYADCIAGAISFDNASASPLGTAVSASGTGTMPTVSLTGTTSGDYVLSFVGTGAGVGSATSPTTVSWKLNVSGNTNGDNAVLGQQISGGGTVTPAYSVTNDRWGILAVEVF